MKEVRIIVPKGMEIDRENSTFECIKFKLKAETYEDVAKKLFSDNNCYHIAQNCTTEKQAQKLLAINKLMNVAKYLNDGWQPDWNNISEPKIYIYININNKVSVGNISSYNLTNTYFKSEKLAKKAIDILGEETIKLALCTDY